MSEYDRVRAKVAAIFRELAGERATAVDGLNKEVIRRIKGIHKAKYGERQASVLGMHMSDWNYDAAFIVALHLFPERFTDEEIEAGIGLFLTHAPNHIRAACGITDSYVWADFPESDPSHWEDAPK